ncbi:MAG: DUF4349 domain-containing protein [Bacteroidota bacterium]
MSFETEDVKQTRSLITSAVQDLNGYVSKDNVYDYIERVEHQLEIRIPAESFDQLLTLIIESADKLGF